MADRVEGLREIQRYDDDIWVGPEQSSDGMEKGDDGSRRGTSRTESKLIGLGSVGPSHVGVSALRTEVPQRSGRPARYWRPGVD